MKFYSNDHYSFLLMSILITLDGDIECNPGPLCSLDVAHLNICSIRNKLDIIETEFRDKDIICITESHLNETVDDNDLLIENFSNVIFRKDRYLRPGGGIVIYHKDTIIMKRRTDLEVPDLELLWVEITVSANKLLLGCIYRPPDSNVDYWDRLDNLLYHVTDNSRQTNLDIIITGDINVNMLTMQPNSHLSRLLVKYNLSSYVNEPTRITPNSSTLIDIIFSNNDNIVKNVNVTPPICSDHSVINFSIPDSVFKQHTYTKYIMEYANADVVKMNQIINNTDWVSISNQHDVNGFNSVLVDTINNVIEECIPRKKITIRPNDKPWMTNEIRLKIRQRNRIHKKATRTNHPNHWANFRNIRNETISLIRECKSLYIEKLESSLNDSSISSSSWWKTAKSILKINNKMAPIPPLNCNNTIIFHPFDKAECLVDHFTAISTSSDNIDPLPPVPDSPYTLSNIIIHEQDVRDQLSLLNDKKPAGPDGMVPKIIKLLSHSLVTPLVILYNKTMQCSSIPLSWKLANINAIYKGKGNTNDVLNYRPISITSCFGKMLEKIVFKHLYNHLLEFEIITKYQSGFIPGDSTVYQLLSMYNTIVSKLDKGLEIRSIFCDVSKAFDRVWHPGLLYKLEMYGIKGKLLDWFRNYLTNRKHRVMTEGFFSTYRQVSAGVPQGSVLGPFLFLIYINDIVEYIENEKRLFADDTSLFKVIETNPQDAANSLYRDLCNIDTWSKIWDIKFNPSKTESLTFSRKREIISPDIAFQNEIVKNVSSHMHLGLFLSEDGKWHHHINFIYTKVFKRINLLKSVKYKMSRKSLITIYTAYIRPILEYGDVIYDNCTQQEATLLESAQLEVARIITGLRRGTSHFKLYTELGWDTLATRRKKHRLILLYKILQGTTPTYLNELVEPHFNQINDNYLLRNTRVFTIPRSRTNLYLKSFIPNTLNDFNNLAARVDLTSVTSLYQFKKILTKSISDISLDNSRNISYFNAGQRKYNILLCQLRNFASNLKYDLYRDHLADSPTCSCGTGDETAQHYFFHCMNFYAPRETLSDKLLNNDHNHFSLDILLSGCSVCNDRVNIFIFDSTIEYIRATNRF